MFTPLGLDHIVLKVRDQAAARRFYEDVLHCGLDHVNERLSLVQLRFGEHLIDLLPLGADAPPEAAARLDHFCLSIRCDDLHGLAAELKRRGVAVEGEIADRRGAYGAGSSLYIRDPDGYRIELKPR
jgi:glyoxylase I family protein